MWNIQEIIFKLSSICPPKKVKMLLEWRFFAQANPCTSLLIIYASMGGLVKCPTVTLTMWLQIITFYFELNSIQRLLYSWPCSGCSHSNHVNHLNTTSFFIIFNLKELKSSLSHAFIVHINSRFHWKIEGTKIPKYFFGPVTCSYGTCRCWSHHDNSWIKGNLGLSEFRLGTGINNVLALPRFENASYFCRMINWPFKSLGHPYPIR